MESFDGLGVHLGNLSRISAAQTRSISAENFTGAKGQGGMATEGTGAVAARELGQGWKISVTVQSGAIFGVGVRGARRRARSSASGSAPRSSQVDTSDWRRIRVLEPRAERVPPLILRAITSGRSARSAALLVAGTAGSATKTKNSGW